MSVLFVAGSWRRFFGLLGLGVYAALAQAQDGLVLIDPVPKDTTRIALGPGLLGFAEYPGARATRYLPILALDIYSPQGWFISTDYGLGWNFSRSAELQYGVRLYPQWPRRASSNAQLRGMGDIGPRVEQDAFLNYQAAEFLLLQSSVRHGGTLRQADLQVELGATAGVPLGDKAVLGLTVGATWANGAYRQRYFGVDAEQARQSGYAAYALSSGMRDLSAALSMEYRVSKQWRFDAQLALARLTAALAASPVCASRTQTTVSAALYYEFR